MSDLDFFNRLGALKDKDDITEITDALSWSCACLNNTPLKISSTVFSFFSVRQSNPLYLYPTFCPSISVWDVERLYVTMAHRVLTLPETVDGALENQILGELGGVLSKLTIDLNKSYREFILINVLGLFNEGILKAKTSPEFKLTFITRLLPFFKIILSDSFKMVNCYKPLQEALSSSDDLTREAFLDNLFLFSWDTLINEQSNLLIFLLRDPGSKQRTETAYLRAITQDYRLVLNYKDFFWETNLKYPLTVNSTRSQIDDFFYVYYKLNSKEHFDAFTHEDLEILYAVLQKKMPISFSSSFETMKRLMEYYLQIRIDNAWDPANKALLEEIIKFYFDNYVKERLNPVDQYFIKECSHPQYYLFNWRIGVIVDKLDLIYLNLEISLKDNLKKLFKYSSPRFIQEIKQTLHNEDFYFINPVILNLSHLAQLVDDVNYKQQIMKHFFLEFPVWSLTYRFFILDIDRVGSYRYQLAQANSFLRHNYSPKKIVSMLNQCKDPFHFMDQMVECSRGYQELKDKVATLNEPQLTSYLSLPKKIKTIDQLHTEIYTKISLIDTVKVDLYPLDSPIWALDGFMFLDKSLKFVVPKTSIDLKLFSLAMRNCIGGYVTKILSGESIVLNILDNNIPAINVEIKNQRINEIKRVNNQLVTKQEQAEIQLILAQAKLIYLD